MKNILAIATIAAISTPVLADDVEIYSPDADQVIYSDTLVLNAADETAIDNTARWAVRAGTCAPNTMTVAGNVDGYADAFTWEQGIFNAVLDIEDYAAGAYCFVLNTMQGEAEGNRQTQQFYIVDDYAKVGGTFGEPSGNGKSLSYSAEGVIGSIGSGAVVGSITVNYRTLNEERTFTPTSISIKPAAGATGNDAPAKAVIMTTDGSQIQVLKREAAEGYPRGAIIVRAIEGCNSHYTIDNSDNCGGADSWVPMEKGNNLVGTR